MPAYSTTNEPNGNALQLVNEAHDRFFAKSEDTLSKSQQYIQALANFTTTPTSFNVGFDFDGQLAQFQRPAQPSIDEGEFAFQPQEQPGVAPGFAPQDVPLDELPTFDEPAPQFQFGPRPERPDVDRPVAPDRPAPLQLPEEPNYANLIPDPVTLRELNLPTFPDLALPEFTAYRPNLPPFDFVSNAQFTPEQYVSQLLAKITGKVSDWMDGQEVLPTAIRRALFDRARARIEVERAAAEAEVWDDYAARGFSQPPGMLAARIDAIRQRAQDQVAEANRELTIKDYDEMVTNMRMAVQEGIRLEGVTINLHMETQRLMLASAQFLHDTGLAVLNARIAHYNAELQALQIETQVYEVRLRGELSKLDVLRARIEAERLKGEINEQTVRLYQAQWQAVQTMADFYRTRMDAVKIQADAQKIPIEIFAEECRAFGIMWDAYGKEWDGYRASVEGENAKATLYRSMVEAFAARTQGVVQQGGLKMDRERLRMAGHEQQLRQYEAGLRRLSLLLEGEQARLRAVAQKTDAKVGIYRAAADVEQAASAAIDRSFQLGLEKSKADMEAQLETARIRSTENVQLQNLTLEAMKALAQIMSQLAASTMSAVNYGASVSASEGFQRSRSVSWSGEAEDWNSSFV